MIDPVKSPQSGVAGGEFNRVKYSFIIPVKEINDYIRETVPKILEMERDDFEIIIYPDIVSSEAWPKTRQIASGPNYLGGPAMKRSLALRDAQGDFLVFIDDDAYPQRNVLEILEEDFKNEEIAAVGGPAVTPKSDSFWQKVSGAVYLSYFSGGFPERYAPVGKKRLILDWPTVNLTVRKKVFLEVGGFDCQYWPGEDTKFCLDVISKLGKNNKILYDPAIIVFHHRREGLLWHLKQIAGYGLHRGHFAKKFPKTSFKLKYFLPSSFFVFTVFGWIPILFLSWYIKLYFLGWIVYGLAMLKVFFDILIRQKDFLVALYSIPYVILTHLVYGARFIQGFVFTKELKSKFR